MHSKSLSAGEQWERIIVQSLFRAAFSSPFTNKNKMMALRKPYAMLYYDSTPKSI